MRAREHCLRRLEGCERSTFYATNSGRAHVLRPRLRAPSCPRQYSPRGSSSLRSVMQMLSHPPGRPSAVTTDLRGGAHAAAGLPFAGPIADRVFTEAIQKTRSRTGSRRARVDVRKAVRSPACRLGRGCSRDGWARSGAPNRLRPSDEFRLADWRVDSRRRVARHSSRSTRCCSRGAP